MNLTKKQMMVAAIVIGAVAVWYFFIRKKKLESSYDENVMIFGNENGFAAWNKTKDWRKTVANPGGESGYSTSAVTYGGTKAATALGAPPVRPMPISAPIQPVGSNEGQKCNKDHQCSPGLYCVNGRCGKKGRGMVSVGSIKNPYSPYTGESGFNIQGANDWIINCIGQQQASNPEAFDLAESTQLCSYAYNKRKVKITKNQAVN